MKQILLTEKEMVFFVLLYVHETTNYKKQSEKRFDPRRKNGHVKTGK